MLGSSRPERALAALALVTAGASVSAETPWRPHLDGALCPIERRDADAHPLTEAARLPGPVVAEPPATETVMVMQMDPPTRAGFRPDGAFVCCGQGARDREVCEVTPLPDGAATRLEIDAEAPPDWLGALGGAAWPFADLVLVWRTTGPDEATTLETRLRHQASGAEVPLGSAAVGAGAAFALWAVRVSLDGARIALVRHAFMGENTDFYPVTLFDLLPVAMARTEGARRLAALAADAAALAAATRTD